MAEVDFVRFVSGIFGSADANADADVGFLTTTAGLVRSFFSL